MGVISHLLIFIIKKIMIKRLGIRNIARLLNPLWDNLFGVWNADGTNNTTVKNAWNANGDAVDSKSGANGTIAAPSGTSWVPSTMTYGSGKLGTGSFTFDGSNFVSLPNNTFTFTGDFTVGCWFFVPTDYVSNSYLLSAFDNTSSYPTYRGWWVGYDSTNKNIYFRIGDSTQGSYGLVNLSTANNTITPGQWNHVMVTREKSTRSRIYINGVLSISDTNIKNPLYNNGWSSIGSSYFAFSQPFWTAANAGLKIDAVQTWNGSVLDSAAISELYNSGNGQEYPFTLSNALIGSPNDSVGTNHGTLVNGTTFTTGKIGKAFLFDGINDYVALPVNSMRKTTFSMNFWIFNPTAQYKTLFTDFGHDGQYKGFYLDLANLSSHTIRFVAFNNNTNIIALNAVGGIGFLNRWSMTTLVVDGTSVKIYLDGSLTASGIMTNTINYVANSYPCVGAYKLNNYTPSGYLNGKIDAVSVWNRELTEAEVTELYNSGNGKQYKPIN